METVVASLLGALRLCALLFLIIVPLTMFYEFLKAKTASLAAKEHAMGGISAKGLVPLVTGIIIGITYGASVIIHSIRASDISKAEAFRILLYLSVCHAMIEDTLIFVVIGANGLILVAARFILATALTYGAYRAGFFQKER